MRRRITAGLFFCFATACADGRLRIDAPEDAVVLSGASVYLGDNRTLDDALVILDGDRIASVVPRPLEVEYTLPASATVVDLRGRTIVPGLIDLHTHLGADGCFAGMNESRLRRELRADLSNGVTTVLDLGSLPWLGAMRQRAATGEWDTPEILLAGPMITVPGGHPVAADGKYAAMARRVSDVQQARLAVEDIADSGANVVKAVLESGGFGGMGVAPSLTPEQLAAIADEAHARAMRLFVHVSTANEARIAIEAGADVLAHVPISDRVDASLAHAIAKSGVPVISTLSAFEGFYRLVDAPEYLDSAPIVSTVDADVIDACRGADVLAFADTNPFTVYAREQAGVATANIAALRGAGASVVLGTDAGNLYVFHGPAVHRELRLLVAAGMTPADAVDAATRGAADALGRTDIGAVRPGRRADFAIFAGNPAQRIEDLDRLEIVVRAGRFYDRRDLLN